MCVCVSGKDRKQVRDVHVKLPLLLALNINVNWSWKCWASKTEWKNGESRNRTLRTMWTVKSTNTFCYTVLIYRFLSFACENVESENEKKEKDATYWQSCKKDRNCILENWQWLDCVHLPVTISRRVHRKVGRRMTWKPWYSNRWHETDMTANVFGRCEKASIVLFRFKNHNVKFWKV